MAKTAYSTSARRTKMEVELTSAINTALTLGIATPPETLDISSIHVEIAQGQVATREVDEQHVTGDLSPILTPDGVVSSEKYQVTILYTQGKDQVGSGNWDYYSDILAKLPLQGTLPSLQHKWSPSGGAVGDEQYVTSATETYVTAVPKPVGGNSSEKIKITYEFITPVVGDPVIIT